MHVAEAVLYRRRNTTGSPLILWLLPYPAAPVLGELGEGGLVTPQHLRPVLLRPAFVVPTPRKASHFVCWTDMRLPFSTAIPKTQ